MGVARGAEEVVEAVAVGFGSEAPLEVLFVSLLAGIFVPTSTTSEVVAAATSASSGGLLLAISALFGVSLAGASSGEATGLPSWEGAEGR